MNPDSTPKTRSIWPTLRVKIERRRKVGANRHFQASWASQLMWCLLYSGTLLSIHESVANGFSSMYADSNRHYHTSNVTGRYRGPKQKLRTRCRAPSRHRRATWRQSYFCLLNVVDCNARHIFHRRVWYRALSLRYMCIRSSGIILIP